MKIKRSMIGAFALAAILGLTNIGTVNAQDTLEDASTQVKAECPNNNCKKPCASKPGHKNIFMQSIEELQKDGTLTAEDVNNIKEYRRKEKEEMKQKIVQEQSKRIDQMVQEKVITKQQGTKLKETMEKNLNNLEKECN